MSEKPVKLTKPQARWLAEIINAPRPPDYDCKPATTCALIEAGLVEIFVRKPNAFVAVQSLRATDAGRAHPAATQGGEAP